MGLEWGRGYGFVTFEITFGDSELIPEGVCDAWDFDGALLKHTSFPFLV